MKPECPRTERFEGPSKRPLVGLSVKLLLKHGGKLTPFLRFLVGLNAESFREGDVTGFYWNSCVGSCFRHKSSCSLEKQDRQGELYPLFVQHLSVDHCDHRIVRKIRLLRSLNALKEEAGRMQQCQTRASRLETPSCGGWVEGEPSGNVHSNLSMPQSRAVPRHPCCLTCCRRSAGAQIVLTRRGVLPWPFFVALTATAIWMRGHQERGFAGDGRQPRR